MTLRGRQARIIKHYICFVDVLVGLGNHIYLSLLSENVAQQVTR